MARKWTGRAVLIGNFPEHSRWATKIEVTEEAARKLALALAKLKQTTIMVPPEVDEVLTALNYVLVGDPNSVAAHKRMEASKGMEPSGG